MKVRGPESPEAQFSTAIHEMFVAQTRILIVVLAVSMVVAVAAAFAIGRLV